MLRYSQWTRCLERSQPAIRSSGMRVSMDHFPKSCGPPEYHLRLKRLTRTFRRAATSKIFYRTCRNLPLREDGPPNHHDDKVDSDQ